MPSERGREVIALFRTPTGGVSIWIDGELWRGWTSIGEVHHWSVLGLSLMRAVKVVMERRMAEIPTRATAGTEAAR